MLFVLVLIVAAAYNSTPEPEYRQPWVLCKVAYCKE